MYGERVLAAWMERYVSVSPGGYNTVGRTVHTKVLGGTFIGARGFVARHGGRLVLTALHDMTEFVQDLPPDGRFWRCWKPAIVSPAQYLNWYVRQLSNMEVRDGPDAEV